MAFTGDRSDVTDDQSQQQAPLKAAGSLKVLQMSSPASAGILLTRLLLKLVQKTGIHF